MNMIECAECGTPFKPVHRRHKRRFCGPACNIVWKNRRAVRGGILYDFIMSKRYDRVNEAEARSIMENLARAFRDSDKLLREGRPSWLPFEDAKSMVPMAFGSSGDGR